MLQLTKRTEYGLIALSHLAERPGEFVSVREICERVPVPRRLVAEVLKNLCRERLLESQRGAGGGYALNRPADAISVRDVVAILEGEPPMASCRTGSSPATNPCTIAGVCPIRDPIRRLRTDIWHLLERTSLRDLITSPDPYPSPAE